MIGAMISLIFGALSLLTAVPVVLPVIGLGLAVNAIIKESKKEKKNKAIKIISIIAIIANAFVTIMFVIHSLSSL